MSETALDRFFKLEREKYGKAAYYFKGDKTSSKIRAFYARPFCPTYMQSFSTTMYPDTFFAEKKRGKVESCLETEYHENVHKWDRWKQGIKFTFKYVWPHWMGVPFLAAVVALGGLWSWLAFGLLLVLFHTGLGVLAGSAGANVKEGTPSKGASIAFYVLLGIGGLALLVATILGAKWWAFLWFGAALFFSPWPFKPVGRRNAELRGYTMSLYRIWLKYKDRLNEDYFQRAIEHYVKTFSGPNYFFMEPDEEWTRRELTFQVGRFRNNEEAFLQNWAWSQERGRCYPDEAEPFRMAKAFIEQEGFGG